MGWDREGHRAAPGPAEPEQYERLLSGLAMVIGWEASIVLTDLRGLPLEEQHETSLWAARAVIAAALNPTPGPETLDPDAPVPDLTPEELFVP